METLKKPFVALTVIAIIVISLASVGPLVYKLITNPGIRTGGINAENAVPATTGVDGHWNLVPGSGANTTGVGFTFNEVLPGERKSTSGSTYQVTGFLDVSDGQLTDGEVVADATTIKTDIEKRDINVRRSILHTDDFPTATFQVKGPIDLTDVPDDGTVANAEVPGVLTLHGTSRDVTPTLDVLRTGERVIVAGVLTVDRTDYNIYPPEFVAATIAEKGEINIRLVFEK
ncbi:YceI family protein [Corynebacterium sp. CCM 8835]|uniref:YceI family protein n=1 Tax=Corynebacterium antarcticum TaxID=2800405 RepID=A0ABS1FK88_9CORY|nr:YceI family protein [Corynebacterium antarcticum]MCK7641365.1 YceI family protein [Corynebacterium antarcticum]MCL0244596.1 YceI family protein [Corynebacterium antarcticum]MCX7490966.1 YceI family protein [Corynebacterium antarcticum]MCX7539847.1 YceI family protein [Corynebacterium antarcticum]